MPYEEEPDQVTESEPEEESEEANSDTDSGETVPYSVIHGDDTSSEEVKPLTPSPPPSPNPIPLRNEWVNFIGLARRRTARKTIKQPSIGSTKPQHDPEAQLSQSTTEDSDAVMEALDDHLV
ncbi:hypothetical protein L1987_80977 [Smallanthus sonchifolius]|uniref:Uncharacterized protein n=1 Tax=Smallanthus sonchifolius TaxID=185202 RepID=A0ACB8YPC7_9ASTR|nr:hypothetical protein L1987_80977 [Smallanthus sonchifolius]